MRSMKTTLLAVFALCAVMAASSSQPVPAADGRVFELRTYHTATPTKLEALHTRFRNHSIKLLEKHGMTLIGFWVPTDAEKGRDNTLVYLVAHKSREAAKASWAAFGSDPEWVAVKAESEREGVLAERVESVFMSPTDYSRLK
jgi:hypothetical protein